MPRCRNALLAKLTNTNDSYLKSPIVELVVGPSGNQSKLTAHTALLKRSPFLAETLANKQVSLRLFRPFPDYYLHALLTLGRSC